MSQHGKAGINRMHEPKARDFLRRESCHATTAAACARKRSALFVQNSNQTPGDHHQALAGGDLQARRYEPRIVKKMSRAIAHDAGNGETHHSFPGFHVEEETNVFASPVHGTVVPPAIVVLQALYLRSESQLFMFRL